MSVSATDERSAPSPTPAPPSAGGGGGLRRLIGMLIAGPAVAVGAALYVIVSPLVSLAAGAVEILAQVRDTIVRPRPFVGARHGLPFLDPAPPPRRVGEPPAE
jgi:hypothetical protein